MKIITCLPEASRLALAFHADPCEYVYDSDPRLPPQRVFQHGPQKLWAMDGRGFPDPEADVFSVEGLRRGMRGYLNAEHYGPDFYTKQGDLPQPMRALGLGLFGSQEAAKLGLCEWLVARLLALQDHCGECGAYNWYPFDGMSDYRAIVLDACDVWSPSLYVQRNGDKPSMLLPLAPRIMPPKPVVPVVCLQANDGSMLGLSSWTATFHYAMNLGAQELLLWGVEKDIATVEKASQFMANGAKVAGVTLASKTPGPGPADPNEEGDQF